MPYRNYGAQEAPDGLERKTQLSTVPDEAHYLELRFSMEAMSAAAATVRSQQPNTLIVANGVDVHSGLFRQGTNQETMSELPVSQPRRHV